MAGIKSVPNINAAQKTLDAEFAAGANTATFNESVEAMFPDVSATNPGVFVVDRLDANGAKTPLKRDYCTFTGVAGAVVSGVVKNADGSGSDQGHAVGAIVEFVPDVLWAQSVRDTFEEQHNADGTHKTATVTTLKATGAEVTTGTEDAKIVTPKALKDAGIVALSKASGVEVNAGTDDAKYATSKAIKDGQRLVTAYTPAGAGTTTIDLSLGNVFTVTMPAATQTLAISNETAGQCFILSINNVTSQGALTWFSTIRWARGVTPTLTGTNGKRDVFGFIVTGTDTYDGFIVGQNI